MIPYFLTIHICTGSHCPAVAAVAVEGGESGVTVSIIQGKQPVECTHFSMGTFGNPFRVWRRLLLQPFLCRKLPPHLSYLKNLYLCQLAISMLSLYSKAIKAAFQNYRCENLKTLWARGRWCAAISASAAARWHGGRGGAETDIACLHLTGSFILRDSATRHQTHTGRWGEFPHNRVSLHTLDTLCLIWKPHDC